MVIATAPILPAEEVLKLLSTYQIFVDSKTGLAITLREESIAALNNRVALVKGCIAEGA